MSQCCKINKIVLFYIIEALVFDFKPYVIELKIQNKFGHFGAKIAMRQPYTQSVIAFFLQKKRKGKEKLS